MNLSTRLQILRVVLIAVGLIFIVGVYPMMMAWWPSGWRWQPNQPEYEQMILGVYAMQAFKMPAEHGHLLGDVPALIIVALVLAILTPRGAVSEPAAATS